MLKVHNIDSERMVLRIECGKGGQHRNAILPADLLDLLRQWWKGGRLIYLGEHCSAIQSATRIGFAVA